MESIFNNTSVDYPKEKSLHSLIVEASQKYPDSIAIKFHERSLTYTEFNQTANRLAKILIEQGIKAGDVIGLALDRTPEMIMSLVAIMKTGAAYVPLDPEYPKDRIEFMLEDSGAKVLLTSQKYKGHYAGNTIEVLIEEALAKSANYSTEEPAVEVTGKDLAYILYTSGSTGKPKGVQIPHGALVNLELSMQKRPGMVPTDKMLAVSTISFDIAGLDLYLPLITGEIGRAHV